MSNEPKAGMNLDPEMLAAYIDKRLSPEQRADVEAQLAKDPDGYAVLVETMKAIDDIQVPEVPKVRRWVTGAGVLAAAAALILVIRVQPEFLRSFFSDRVDPRLERLVAAVGTERSIEARLTGGFNYGPLKTVSRGAGDLSRQNLALLAAAGELQKQAAVEPTADNAGLLGVALIQLGDLDGGTAQLEKAAALRSSGEHLSNLAAAYLARAESSTRDADLAAALETINRALAESPELPEALFNRAIVLEKFRLNDSAVKAWDAYLLRDDRSSWADEARRRRAALMEQSRTLTPDEAILAIARQPNLACELVARDSLLMREAIEDVLLPDWADGVLSGQPASDSILRSAEAIAACFTNRIPGELTSGAVAAIVKADQAGRAELARAHQLWRTGRRAYARSAPDEFAPAFLSARPLFERHGSPLALWTQQYEIAALFYRGQLPEAVAAVDALEKVSGVVEGGALWARLRWIRASIHFQAAAFGRALTEYRQALSAFEVLHENEHVLAMHQSLAEAYGRLGLEREAWQEHRRALEYLASARDYRRIHSAITAPGYTASIAGLPSASLDFFNEGHARAVASANLNYQFECEVGMGRALMALGRYPHAEEIYQSALTLSAKVSNPSLRARHTADVYTGLAEVAAGNREYAASLKLIDEALAGVGSVSSEYLVAGFHLRRGRTLVLMGKPQEAKAAMAAGIDVLESKRALLQQAAQRVAYTDRAFELYSDVIALVALDLDQQDEALMWAERSRARSIQDSRPLPAFAALRKAALPDRRAIIVLAQTDRGLLVWLLKGAGAKFHASRQSDIADRFRLASSSPTPELLERAYREIVEPFEADLEGIDRVTVVPDWATQSIPFAALRDGTRPWISKAAIDLAPTVSIALVASSSAESTARLKSVAVITSGDSSDRSPALPGAREESRAIAQMYPEALTLTGHEATIQAMREAMRKVDVMHIAMHARADGRYLDRFTLDILDEATGLPLSAESMLGSEHAPRVVVLAACQTAHGPRVRGEILMSLARPFMLSGSRYVVATLWDVPDRATNELMTALHEGLTSGKPPAVALSDAQRRFAASAGEPWWSAFVLITTA